LTVDEWLGLGIFFFAARFGQRLACDNHVEWLWRGIRDRAGASTVAMDLGARVAFDPGDLSRPNERSARIDRCGGQQKFGALDIRVNNAGIQHTAK